MDTTDDTRLISSPKDAINLVVLATAVVIAAKGWKMLFRDVSDAIDNWTGASREII